MTTTHPMAGSVRVVSKRQGGTAALTDETVIDVDRVNPVLGNRHILRNHHDDAERAVVIGAYEARYRSLSEIWSAPSPVAPILILSWEGIEEIDKLIKKRIPFLSEWNVSVKSASQGILREDCADLIRNEAPLALLMRPRARGLDPCIGTHLIVLVTTH